MESKGLRGHVTANDGFDRKQFGVLGWVRQPALVRMIERNCEPQLYWEIRVPGPLAGRLIEADQERGSIVFGLSDVPVLLIIGR